MNGAGLEEEVCDQIAKASTPTEDSKNNTRVRGNEAIAAKQVSPIRAPTTNT